MFAQLKVNYSQTGKIGHVLYTQIVEVLALFYHDQLIVYSISAQKTFKNHLPNNVI
ncbi:hypothetical protein [Candidatus Protochlamydia sp. W-9]|uniref:hypothetical protein n=1 Tax=Candidatus Protochlamydia sp. W-9 TaxID=1785087 RepID=UPI000A895DA8